MQLQKMREEYGFLENYVYYALFFFLISVLLGYYTAATQTQEVIALIDSLATELEPLMDLGPVTLFLLIFLNNSIKTFVMMLLGVFFGIVPAIFLISNGYILGIVGHLVGHEVGMGSLFVGIVPHGIIEIPVMLFAAAYGLWLGARFMLTIKYGESIKYHIQSAVKTYIHVFVPLFFFAAFIEVFITEYLLNFFS